jgi:hypothetical protein
LTVAAREDVEQFRDRIEAELGLSFGDDRAEQVAQTLASRSDILQMSYFFRHADHLSALVEVAIPERVAAHPHDRVLRLLSVGCAGGEEPYTLSMTVLQHKALLRGWDVQIRACDLNAEALRHAERGIYTPWARRATSASDKWLLVVNYRIQSTYSLTWFRPVRLLSPHMNSELAHSTPNRRASGSDPRFQ